MSTPKCAGKVLDKFPDLWYNVNMNEYTIHFDGSCWPNPGGTAAYGFTVDGPEGELAAEAGVTGTSPAMSNNVAEFDALCKGLNWLIESGPHKAGDRVHVRGDSMLVTKMMTGEYRANPTKLYFPYYKAAFKALSVLDVLDGVEVDFTWIPREENTRCDDLSKEHNHAPR